MWLSGYWSLVNMLEKYVNVSCLRIGGIYSTGVMQKRCDFILKFTLDIFLAMFQL